MSFNTYNPRILGRYNTEFGDELAPGGPVGYWRGNRGHNNGMNNQYRHNQRQLRQEMQQPPQQLLHPPTPLMRLRQPMSQRPLQQCIPEEEQTPFLEQLEHPKPEQPSSQEDEIPPIEKLRQPSPQLPQPSPQLPQPSPKLPQQRQPSPDNSTLEPPSSPPSCTDAKDNQQALEEEMQADECDLMKTSSDKSNFDSTTGNLIGAKVKKKLSKREWRRRQNVHLRRILTPKNALVVLNEMLPGEMGIGQFKVEPAPQHPSTGAHTAHSFRAELTVDGVCYKGYGPSKLTARNDVAEQVFRDLVLKHMVKLQRRRDGDTASSLKTDGPGDGDGEGESSGEEDQALPMIQLASFALHKLFAEWEGDGHKVPRLKALGPPPASEECEECSPSDTVPRPVKQPRALPSAAAAMHPCMLLTYMRPDLHYRQLPSDGSRYTMAIDVDGRTYVGKAMNKRDARKEAARVACTEHFGVKFTDDASAAAATE